VALGNGPPTINDVAALAGVSKRTVTREKIIEELNFVPNRQARGLAASRSFLIGLIFDVPTLFINEAQKGMLDIVEEEGYELVVHACHVHACHIKSDRLIEDIKRFVARAHLDGVIILPPVSDVKGLGQALDAANCRYVRVASETNDQDSRIVVTDYLSAIEDMTRHLVGLGHRDIGFVAGPGTHLSSRKRYDSFVKALASHGLELSPEMIAQGDFDFDSGVAAARQLLSHERRPTAIFAANDEMAFGVMNVAAKMGLRIPDDLSVVGFDGTPFSTFVVPSLSTIIRQTDEMAALGAHKLLAQINEGPEAAAAFDTLVSPRFVPRESTGPVPVS
jgi:LacI family transcriptional regulator